MESYIVRIYRRDQKRSAKVEGVVEKVSTQQRMVFHNLQDLMAIVKRMTTNRIKSSLLER